MGGSGDALAGLSEEERGAYLEACRMGFPPAGWYCHETMGSGYFANISGMIPIMDPTYAEDFWSKPGYLGTDPASTIGADRFAFDTVVERVDAGPPWRLTLAAVPGRDFANAHLVLASGASLPIARSEGRVVTLIAHLDPAVLAGIRAGDAVRIDNSWALALETYHRHQVPPTTDNIGWNQFRGADGTPLFPQRPVLIGPAGTANAAGAEMTGRFHGKAIVLGCLLDIDCHPWQADWYRQFARAALGAEVADANLAVQFVERAHHENPMTALARQHAVAYSGALQQALRDLAEWVEQGRRPPETCYEISDAQVLVPATAAARGGSQLVIALAANGRARTEVAVGETVTFTATVEVPAGTGAVVGAEWDLDQSGDFATAARFAPAGRVELTLARAFDTPGTHFVVLRAHSQRQGDAATPYGRIGNLARVRVVVR